MVFTSRKMSQKKVYFINLTGNRFQLAGMEDMFKNKFLLDGKTAYIDRTI